MLMPKFLIKAYLLRIIQLRSLLRECRASCSADVPLEYLVPLEHLMGTCLGTFHDRGTVHEPPSVYLHA